MNGNAERPIARWLPKGRAVNMDGETEGRTASEHSEVNDRTGPEELGESGSCPCELQRRVAATVKTVVPRQSTVR